MAAPGPGPQAAQSAPLLQQHLGCQVPRRAGVRRKAGLCSLWYMVRFCVSSCSHSKCVHFGSTRCWFITGRVCDGDSATRRRRSAINLSSKRTFPPVRPHGCNSGGACPHSFRLASSLISHPIHQMSAAQQKSEVRMSRGDGGSIVRPSSALAAPPPPPPPPPPPQHCRCCSFSL